MAVDRCKEEFIESPPPREEEKTPERTWLPRRSHSQTSGSGWPGAGGEQEPVGAGVGDERAQNLSDSQVPATPIWIAIRGAIKSLAVARGEPLSRPRTLPLPSLYTPAMLRPHLTSCPPPPPSAPLPP